MTKADLHRLVDRLPDSAVDTAGRLLERATEDPMLVVLDHAPLDDEPYTDEERAADDAARMEPGIPFEKLVKDLRR